MYDALGCPEKAELDRLKAQEMRDELNKAVEARSY